MISIARTFTILCLVGVIALSNATAAPGSKEVFNGYLVDVSCSRDRSHDLLKLGQTHTRKCLLMPDCRKSGYGIVTGSGEFIRFDQKGNADTEALITKLSNDTPLKIAVWGRLQNGVIAVKRLKLVQ